MFGFDDFFDDLDLEDFAFIGGAMGFIEEEQEERRRREDEMENGECSREEFDPFDPPAEPYDPPDEDSLP